MSDDYIDGVSPKAALNAPGPSRDVEHKADPADRFADQMETFDRMRETERWAREQRLLEWSVDAELVRSERVRREFMDRGWES